MEKSVLIIWMIRFLYKEFFLIIVKFILVNDWWIFEGWFIVNFEKNIIIYIINRLVSYYFKRGFSVFFGIKTRD